MSAEMLPPLFMIKKLLSLLIQPPLLPIIVTLCGLLLIRRHPRAGIRLCWLGVIIMLIFSTPYTVNLMLAPLEKVPPLPPQEYSAYPAQAIVVLGAGKRSHAPEFGGETVSAIALERVRYAALLAHRNPLPVLISGGIVSGQYSEAALMRDVMEQEFHTPVRWTEEKSLDTHDNAQFSAHILLPQEIRHILLVTHASHMRRARTEFEAAGFSVTAAPTAWLGSEAGISYGKNLIPSASALYPGWVAAHEWLGILAQQFRRPGRPPEPVRKSSD